jgi:predicted membrane-bound spermidine synthase
MNNKIQKIKEVISKQGYTIGYGVKIEKYGTWGLVVCTPYREIEKKLSSVFGESYLGQDTQGKFFFWPLIEIKTF